MLPFRQTLGFRLLCMAVILLTIPLLVDSFIFLEKRFNQAVRQAERYLIQQADLRIIPFGDINKSNRDILRTVVYFLNLQQGFPQQASEDLNQTLQHLALTQKSDALILVAIDAHGDYKVVGQSSSTYPEENIINFLNFFSPFSWLGEQGAFPSSLMMNPQTKLPLFVTTRSVYSDEGTPLGVLMVIDNVKESMWYLFQEDNARYHIQFALLSSAQVVLAATDPDLDFQYFFPLTFEQKQKVETMVSEIHGVLPAAPLEVYNQVSPPFVKFKWKNKVMIGAQKNIPGSDLFLLAYVSKREIFSAAIFDFTITYGAYLFILVVGVILCYGLSRRLTRPMSSLGAVMLEVEKGHLQSRYTPDYLGYEINQLGTIFNRTVESLIENEKLAEDERIKKELLIQELKLGREVQRQLLPQSVPSYRGVEIAHAFLPAVEVGGDFYDVYVKDDNTLIMVVADASGKGVQACMYALTTKNMIKTLAQKASNVYEAMRQANNLLCDDTGDTGMFVTVFMAQYNHQESRLTYSSCGQNPPMLYRKKTQLIEILPIEGIAMGVIKNDKTGSPHHTQLEPGDILMLYSDGVTEAHDTSKEQFGEQRLQRYIQLEAHRSAQDLTRGLMEEIHLFTKGAKQHDDITIIVMKVRDE